MYTPAKLFCFRNENQLYPIALLSLISLSRGNNKLFLTAIYCTISFQQQGPIVDGLKANQGLILVVKQCFLR